MTKAAYPPIHRAPRGKMVEPRTGRLTSEWQRYWLRVLMPIFNQVLEQEGFESISLAALNRGNIDSRLSDIEAMALQLFAALGDKGFDARIDTLEDLPVISDIVCYENEVVCYENEVVTS